MQIKAHLILFQKGSGVYIAKVHTLGAMDQNVDLLAKMAKIVMFVNSLPEFLKIEIFLQKQKFENITYHLKLHRGGPRKNTFYQTPQSKDEILCYRMVKSDQKSVKK